MVDLTSVYDSVKLHVSEKRYKFTGHAIVRINFRSFSKEDIISFLIKKPVKVENQNEKDSEKYRLFYEFKTDKDLIVVVSIKNNNLYIVTVYVQDVKRR